MKFKFLCMHVCSKVDNERHVNMLIFISRIPVVCGQSIGSVQTKTYIYIYKTGDINCYYYYYD